MTISYAGDFLTLLGRWKGSVWKAVWKEAVVWLFLYYSIRLICVAALDGQQLEHVKKMCALFDSFTAKIPLQFLLGFYVGQVVTRWWAQVQAVPWPDECMVWTNAFFFKDDYTSRAKRRLIARYLILCETLVLRNVSTRIRKRFPTVNTLLKGGLMTEEENELLDKVDVENNQWQLPLQWIINGIIVPAVSQDEIPGAGAATLISKVNDFRNALRLIYIYDWICIPLVYTQTCSVVVYGYFAFCLIGHQYFAQEADLYIPFLTILQFIFFVGWFKVAQDLMRPFGEDDDDFELNVFLDRHAAVAMNFADQLCTLMPSFLHSETSQLVNGYFDEDEISYIDGADKNDKAAMKSVKNDRAPKLHALVKLKSPDDEELITATWIRTNFDKHAPNGTAITEKVETRGTKQKSVKFVNPF